MNIIIDLYRCVNVQKQEIPTSEMSSDNWLPFKFI